ncbi:MAG: twin-arginine translocase subunit TatC [Mycobacteriales bacterium]
MAVPGMRFRVRRVSHDEEVTVVEHLDELRDRLLISLLCLAVAFSVAFWRHEDIVRLLIRQVPKSTDGRQIDLVVLAVGEQFKIAVTISFWAAVLVALPVLFYQLYAYVLPAFSPNRSARTWPLLILVPTLFVCGAVFAYLVVIPAAAEFLLQFDSNLYLVQPRALDWYEFCVTMMLALGLIFELPAAVLVLTRVGIVNSRMLRTYRKYAIVALAVLAAALPGVDPVSMVMELIPLLVLYEFSIVLAKVAERKTSDEDDLDAVPGP